jgi:hypothetical protein
MDENQVNPDEQEEFEFRLRQEQEQAEQAQHQKNKEPEGSAMSPVNPTYVPGSTGLGHLAETAYGVGKQAGTNYLKAAIQPIVNAYTTNPIKAGVTDLVGHAFTGLPLGSIYQSVKNFPDRLEALKQAAVAANAGLSKTPPAEWQQNLAQGKFPEAPEAFRNMRTAAGKIDPQFGENLRKALDAGNDPAVVKLLETAPESVKNNPRFAALAEQYQSAVPGIGTKAMRVIGPVLHGASKIAGPLAAAYEGSQGYNQAQQGDYTGAGLHGLGAVSMLNPVGLLAQPGISMMQAAHNNFKQQTPTQQQESAMAALSGQAPGQAGESLAVSQPVEQHLLRQAVIHQASKQQQLNDQIRMAAAQRALRPVAPQMPNNQG